MARSTSMRGSEQARELARQNIDALLAGNYDAILTNAAGCGSTLKEYDELLENDPAYAGKAHEFVSKMKDVTEFLASIELNTDMRPVALHGHLSGLLPLGARPEDRAPRRASCCAPFPG